MPHHSTITLRASERSGHITDCIMLNSTCPIWYYLPHIIANGKSNEMIM